MSFIPLEYSIVKNINFDRVIQHVLFWLNNHHTTQNDSVWRCFQLVTFVLKDVKKAKVCHSANTRPWLLLPLLNFPSLFIFIQPKLTSGEKHSVVPEYYCIESGRASVPRSRRPTALRTATSPRSSGLCQRLAGAASSESAANHTWRYRGHSLPDLGWCLKRTGK